MKVHNNCVCMGNRLLNCMKVLLFHSMLQKLHEVQFAWGLGIELHEVILYYLKVLYGEWTYVNVLHGNGEVYTFNIMHKIAHGA